MVMPGDIIHITSKLESVAELFQRVFIMKQKLCLLLMLIAYAYCYRNTPSTTFLLIKEVNDGYWDQQKYKNG